MPIVSGASLSIFEVAKMAWNYLGFLRNVRRGAPGKYPSEDWKGPEREG